MLGGLSGLALTNFIFHLLRARRFSNGRVRMQSRHGDKSSELFEIDYLRVGARDARSKQEEG